MSFEIGDKVYYKRGRKGVSWELIEDKEYVIYDIKYDISNDVRYCVGDKHGNTTSWFYDIDFLSAKEQRKKKLEKINFY